MGNGVRPGPSSLAGLAWLARVGPAPVEAWRWAMEWGAGVARSHARRLEREGWLARFRMTHGSGSLFVATRRGVRMSGLEVSAAAAPAPTWWAHDCACAWTAAWLSRRGRGWKGPRGVLCGRSLKGEGGWLSGGGGRGGGGMGGGGPCGLLGMRARRGGGGVGDPPAHHTVGAQPLPRRGGRRAGLRDRGARALVARHAGARAARRRARRGGARGASLEA